MTQEPSSVSLEAPVLFISRPGVNMGGMEQASQDLSQASSEIPWMAENIQPAKKCRGRGWRQEVARLQ